MSVRAYLAIILWITALAAAASLFGKLPSTAAGYRDFAPYYVQSLAMRRGINPYEGDFETVHTEAGRPLGDLDMDRFHLDLHLDETPTWGLFLIPLTFLSPENAYWTWQALNMLALAGALLLLIGDLGPGGVDGWAMAALMVLYPPIAIGISRGRGEMILLFLFALALVAIRRRRDTAAGVALAIAALLRAYPLGMLGYLIARRNWKACAYMVGACMVGGALTVAALGTGPVASFAGGAALLPGRPSLLQPLGMSRHPYNLNLGWFVRFIIDHSIGDRPWAVGAGLVVELIVAGLSFAVTSARTENRYGCGFALWITLVTLLSPVTWWHFLVCLVPVYVVIAAASKDGASSRWVLWTASSSYLAAFFNRAGRAALGDRTVGFINAGLERLLARHVHLWHLVPELTFASLVLAYLSALLMTASGAERLAGPLPNQRK